jgi:RNA polymerase sigma-70 factor (ECF subfamily)
LKKKEHKKLIEKCLKGDPRAQEELYDLFSKDMFRVCLIYSCDYDSANDLLQEGFLKVFQKLHLYKTTGSLGGWIRTVITNSCIDNYRSNKWDKKKKLLDENYQMDNLLITFNEVETRFQNADFLEIIKNLPEGYRMILNLYFLENYKHSEIAEKLDINIGTSKSQLFKAKKYLKKILRGQLTEEEYNEYEGLAKKVV